MKNRTVIIYGDELYHHGVAGQKWGKRNGPPYPLDPEDHSASEKKAGWRKSLQSFVAKRKRPDRLEVNANDSKATKKAKSDYNTMSDSDFFRTYSVSKKVYAKRVAKYGDPTKSKAAQAGKKISESPYGKAVNAVRYSKSLNTISMTGKAVVKTTLQNVGIKTVSSVGAAGLIITGHPVAASRLLTIGNVSIGFNSGHNIIKTVSDIKTSNQYLDKQREANDARNL